MFKNWKYNKDAIETIVGNALGIYMALFTSLLAILVIFKKIPRENAQMATNMVFLFMGILGGVYGKYFSASVETKKTADEAKELANQQLNNGNP
ncbi:MAG: hypothetical protein JST04_00715 [Bdellovibrionales bacterium]|nr:hypothetical protein [Bdellovibrionales bacterium]